MGPAGVVVVTHGPWVVGALANQPVSSPGGATA